MDDAEQQKLTNSCMEDLRKVLETPFENHQIVLATLVAGLMITCVCKDPVAAEGARKVVALIIGNHPKSSELLTIMRGLVSTPR
jgi:hypothetical protein